MDKHADRRVGRILAGVLVAGALVVGACSGDDATADPEATPNQPGPLTGAPAPEETAEPASAETTMPDVVGVQQADAVVMLESAGISDYRFDEQPSLRPSGEVLAQLPSPGQDVRGPVTLTVAAPLPPMPDYTGSRIGDARSELESWGVSVTEEGVLSRDRPSGEVVESTPQASDTIGSEVVLRVAVAPVIGVPGVDVAEVTTGRQGNLNTRPDGPVEINGELYETSLHVHSGRSSADAADLGYWEYNLGRNWEFFESAVGVLDDSDFEQAGRFRIILDGSVIWEEDVEFGQVADVSINVSNGLRLRLEAVSLRTGVVGLGWGDARLLGIPGEAPSGRQSSDDG